MPTAKQFRKFALSLAGTTESPHFDRQAFKVARIYATLAADGLTANLKFTPAEQVLKTKVHPAAFQAVPNAWGKQGWTTVLLAEIDAEALEAALATCPNQAAETRQVVA